MSGHSKWHSIKHKKGAADAKRGKIFTKHAKLITIAARDGGGDPEMNAALRAAIVNAKADNVPNANIEKAVKKGTGTDKDAVNFMEIMYEGFGPAGTAIFVQVITDNRNRAVTSVKTAFTKNGGNMGEAGTVSWMFERKGIIIAQASAKSEDELELAVIEAGAEDFERNGEQFEITTADSDLMGTKDELEKAGFVIEKAELAFVPKDYVIIDQLEDARKIMKLVEALEDEEDVSNVYGNFDIAEDLLEQI